MKAIGYFDPHPIEHPESLVDIELPVPDARGRDLLIEVRAISVALAPSPARRRRWISLSWAPVVL